MARQKRRGRHPHVSHRQKRKPASALQAEGLAASGGLSPFQQTIQQVALTLALVSVLGHAFITLCYGVAPVFIGAPVSLTGPPALFWLAADGVWAWALAHTLRRRRGAPADWPVDPHAARRYVVGFGLAAVAVGLALAGAWQPQWRGWAPAHAAWPLWPVQVALPVCLPLARASFSAWLIGAAFAALMAGVAALKLLGLPRVFLALLAACLAAFAALAWGESCLRFAGARSLAGVALPALQAEALAAPGDFDAWVWALWWTGVLLWLSAAMAGAGIFHLPRAALQHMQAHR